VRFGYRAHGVIVEPVEGKLTTRAFEGQFHDLEIDHDGFVRIAFRAPRLDGTEFPVEIALEVTPNAIKRGSNVDFYVQREFCGACGSDTFEEDVERFYTTGELDPLEPLVGACERWRNSRIILERPFPREVGFAFTASLPDLIGLSDTNELPRRSPFLLCEEGLEMLDPHSIVVSIRSRGRGRYLHWGGHLYFSTSDGSDPNTKGREYALVRMVAKERPVGEGASSTHQADQGRRTRASEHE
jgi:hypothetical protein